MLESKRLADEWLATRSQPAEMAAARAQIAAAARKGPVVLRGLAYAETLPFRFGLFDGRVLKEHKQTVRKLLENNGARLWDRLILPGALGLQVDQEKFRLCGVDDEPVATGPGWRTSHGSAPQFAISKAMRCFSTFAGSARTSSRSPHRQTSALVARTELS